MAARNQQNICFLVFLLMREFFTVGTHKVYSNIYSETRNVKIAKSPKIAFAVVERWPLIVDRF